MPIDYNTLTYKEGRALIKQAAGWDDIVKTVGEYGGKAKDWIGQQAANAAASGIGQAASKAWNDNPLLRHSVYGAGLGGLAGLGSSLFQDEEERSPVSRGILGALLGGLGGAGYSLATQNDSGESAKKIQQDTAKEILERRKARDTGEISSAEGAQPKKQYTPEELKELGVEVQSPLQEMRENFTEYGPDGKPMRPTAGSRMRGAGKTIWNTITRPAENVLSGEGDVVDDAALAAQAAGVGGTVLAKTNLPGSQAANRMLYGPHTTGDTAWQAARSTLERLHPERAADMEAIVGTLTAPPALGGLGLTRDEALARLTQDVQLPAVAARRGIFGIGRRPAQAAAANPMAFATGEAAIGHAGMGPEVLGRYRSITPSTWRNALNTNTTRVGRLGGLLRSGGKLRTGANIAASVGLPALAAAGARQIFGGDAVANREAQQMAEMLSGQTSQVD